MPFLKSQVTRIAVLAVMADGILCFALPPKAEMKKEMEEKIKNAQKEIQDNCGCPGPKFIVDWGSYQYKAEQNDMLRIGDLSEGLNDGTKGPCKFKPEYKASFCKATKTMVVKIHYKKGGEWVASKDGQSFICGTDEFGSTCGASGILEAIEKQ
jgi:hypothetical protein